MKSMIFYFMFILATVSVMAHVTVNPKEAIPGYTTFEVRVPNERPNSSTVEVRLVIPEGVELRGILPTGGWRYEVVHEEHSEEMEEGKAEGHEAEHSVAKVREIRWHSGRINPGEYNSFYISTSYAGPPTKIAWKAYQKYSNNEMVPWDDSNPENPAPKITITNSTKVDELTLDVENLKGRVVAVEAKKDKTSTIVAALALILAAAALIITLKGRKVSL